MYRSYLTPSRFRAAGYGIAIPSDFTNATLRNTLMRASTLVNLYTNRPRFPMQFDYRGGTVTDEQHEWPFVPPLLATSAARRMYLNSRPIQTVSSFRVYLAKNYYVDLSPTNDIFINKANGYCEIVALAPTIIGYWPYGYPLGLWNAVAQVTYTYGQTFSVTDDVLESVSPTTYSASYGSWLEGGTVSVKVNGASVTTFTSNTDDGSITFTANEPTPDQVVTASYSYTLPDGIAQATGIIATWLLAQSRIAARGMIGLSSIKVAEVALTQMAPVRGTVTRNSVTIPAEAAPFLDPFVQSTAA